MPVFNGEKYVGEAIESLLRQSYREFILLISDNASTDSTGDICRAFAKMDPRVHYVRQDKNIGASQNFLYLVKAASSRYFMWSAYDDLWARDYLKTAVGLLDESDGVRFVFPGTTLKSIRYKVFRKIPEDRFSFIRHENMDCRVLGFLNLHPYSHKLNMIYSLFERDLLVDVLSEFEFLDEEIFCTAVLQRARGELARGRFFIKRSLKKWPAMTGKKSISKDKEKIFNRLIDARFNELNEMLPHLSDILSAIKGEFKPRRFREGFQIAEAEVVFKDIEC